MTVSLPANATTVCDVRVTVDGVLDETVSGTMVPAEVGRISFSVKGKSSSVVYIEVDGQIWKKYDIDFVNETNSVSLGSYIPRTNNTESPTDAPDSSETPTEAPTEESTEADDTTE